MGSVVNQLAFLPPQHDEEDKKDLGTHTDFKQIVTKGGSKIAALWFYKEDNDYTILYSHGNAEDLISSQYGFKALSEDLATYDDIESAFNWLTNPNEGPNISPSKIILFGRSLGSGPTVHLAAKYNNLAGLILQSPLRTAIKTQLYHWVASSILKPADIFHNETKITKVTTYPVFIIHGKNDRVVPFSHGEYLYQQVKAKNTCEVRYFWVEGCGHNDIEMRRGDEFRQKLLEFIDECIRKKKQTSQQDDTTTPATRIN
ncbi:hypothetical protein RFI_35299 [Reticulomyxa filosa]|uniref:Peptidase S9 prolyl oligopeptidase catalytic domain-containing protein n=1 Tax=Reticulomyxa filosa TaxID=46433 RepID=X6LN38_RETFI|nr:hypothetical protein RFI_35299 [Reticulomyxa filosa]|eukprot:ETO02140.1 hypothetical protein RFI_35299 [Reticulomyxa filosa]